jgi:hypothetical protein
MGAYVCIAMLEDPPYSIYLAATEEEPEDWCEGLPLPSHLLCYEKFNDPEDFVKQYAKALLVCAIRVLEGKAFPAPPHEVIRCFMKVRDKALQEEGVDLTHVSTRVARPSAEEADLGETVRDLPGEPWDDARQDVTLDGPPGMETTADAEECPDEAIDYDIFEFTAHEDHAVLTRYIGFDDTSIIIPSIWNGLPVTVIGPGAFKKCNELTDVTISHSVEHIGEGAFEECEKLSSIHLPSSLRGLGKHCFWDCKSLKHVTIPARSSLESIGTSCFGRCAALEHITLPDSLTLVGDSAFQHCTNLKEITLPNLIDSINKAAFYFCQSLESVDLPCNIKYIDSIAFSSCNSLKHIEFDEGLVKIGDHAFSGCSSLLEVNLPGSLETIGGGAFRYCNQLKKAILNEGVKAIDNEVFYGCSSLAELHIPNTVESVGKIFDSTKFVTVYCKPGSVAHMYCRDHGIKCARSQ